jgi:hydrogenase maturation protease
MSVPILLIGIGNEYRSDDGVGLAVIRALKARNLPETSCVESAGDGLALLEIWADASRVVVIDAMVSGNHPGTIHRIDMLAQQPFSSVPSYSSHAFGLAETLQLAKVFHLLPEHLIVYSVEGRTFEPGTHLSPEVASVVEEVVTLIMREILSIPFS